MKSVLISLQPYWVFLIIAKAMGWNIGEEKTVEVRKTYPKNENWDKIAKIYCSKNKKSFAKIPKEYQPLMQRFLGKVIGEFVCDTIFDLNEAALFAGMDEINKSVIEEYSCVDIDELLHYKGDKNEIYGWSISDLVIYDKPKELGEFYRECEKPECDDCQHLCIVNTPNCYEGWCDCDEKIPITRPPQSWCYVEEVQP